jgi:hypothetical protein
MVSEEKEEERLLTDEERRALPLADRLYCIRRGLKSVCDKLKPGESLPLEIEDLQYLIDLVPAGIDHQIDSAEEQRIVDLQRLDQAAKIIGSPVSLEQATDFAINWCAIAMQETCNADYWKERAQAAERLNAFKGKVAS